MRKEDVFHTVQYSQIAYSTVQENRENRIIRVFPGNQMTIQCRIKMIMDKIKSEEDEKQIPGEWIMMSCQSAEKRCRNLKTKVDIIQSCYYNG